ncbi:benenodin family lasso peptide [Sphingopyxis granuli]|jgi:hypothetical protein
MERDTNDLVELGAVTEDTAGDGGPAFEPGGRMPHPGLTQD